MARRRGRGRRAQTSRPLHQPGRRSRPHLVTNRPIAWRASARGRPTARAATPARPPTPLNRTPNPPHGAPQSGAKAGVPAGPEAAPAGRFSGACAGLPSAAGETVINGSLVITSDGAVIDGLAVYATPDGPGEDPDAISASGGTLNVTVRNAVICAEELDLIAIGGASSSKAPSLPSASVSGCRLAAFSRASPAAAADTKGVRFGGPPEGDVGAYLRAFEVASNFFLQVRRLAPAAAFALFAWVTGRRKGRGKTQAPRPQAARAGPVFCPAVPSPPRLADSRKTLLRCGHQVANPVSANGIYGAPPPAAIPEHRITSNRIHGAASGVTLGSGAGERRAPRAAPPRARRIQPSAPRARPRPTARDKSPSRPPAGRAAAIRFNSFLCDTTVHNAPAAAVSVVGSDALMAADVLGIDGARPPQNLTLEHNHVGAAPGSGCAGWISAFALTDLLPGSEIRLALNYLEKLDARQDGKALLVSTPNLPDTELSVDARLNAWAPAGAPVGAGYIESQAFVYGYPSRAWQVQYSPWLTSWAADASASAPPGFAPAAGYGTGSARPPTAASGSRRGRGRAAWRARPRSPWVAASPARARACRRPWTALLPAARSGLRRAGMKPTGSAFTSPLHWWVPRPSRSRGARAARGGGAGEHGAQAPGTLG